MSDKKKKNYTAKEPMSPRRPIILKSDRDLSRDQGKEKPEKEKDKPPQPTIILKTREQSTPKDERPHSPKSLKAPTSENELVHPKIAHNEHKEKKEHKPIPLKVMSEPVKLIDENFEFNNAGVEFLSDLSTNYLVVGVIGMQGVGKSMIMNLITQDTFNQNLCPYIINTHEINKETNALTDMVSIENQMETLELNEAVRRDLNYSEVDFKFKMQNIDQIEKGTHCTKGVDMYVTSDRVVVLDCQAVGASRGEDPRGAPTDCLQLTSFLMSVCHVLVAVQDWFTDYNFLRYIQTAEMLTPSLSSSSAAPAQDGSESTSSGEVHPHLLLMHNRCQLEDFTPESVKTMQDLYRKAFQKSNVQLNSGMYMYSDSNRNGLDVDQVCKGYGVAECGEPLNLFLLPEIYDDYDNREIYRGHPPFEKLARRLRWMIFGVNRHQITNVANLSEKGWFQYCAKAWETIRMCTFFLEYERFLP